MTVAQQEMISRTHAPASVGLQLIENSAETPAPPIKASLEDRMLFRWPNHSLAKQPEATQIWLPAFGSISEYRTHGQT